jgi:hypothetical protein
MTDPPPDEGPRKDQDDPNAPILLTEKTKDDSQGLDASQLNNGRPPSAVPKPLDQIKQASEKDAAASGSKVEKLDMGRDPDAKPGQPPADSAGKRATDPDAGMPDVRTPKSRPDTKVDAARPEKAVSRPKKKLADLPASVQSLDKDGDGQIGLYEWPREKISQFTDLDGDKDGFLTPQELHDGAESQRDKPPAAKQESAGAQSTEASGDGGGVHETKGDQGVQEPTSNPSTE